MKRTPLTRKTPLRAHAPMRRGSRPKMTPARKSAARDAPQQDRYWDFVGSLPCQLCGAFGVQISHSNRRRGMGQKAEWWDVAALCPSCHHDIDNGKDLSQWERRAQHDHAVCKTFGAAVRAGIWEVKQ